MSDKVYPYIAVNPHGVEMLVFKKNLALILNHPNKGDVHEMIDSWERRLKNITREYLANTWGVVESPEHAEFIRELAVKHGYEFTVNHDKPKVFYFADDLSAGFWASDANINVIKSVAKQITIPMPPKPEAKPEAKQESPELVVGDIVTIFTHDDYSLGEYTSDFVGRKGRIDSIFESGLNGSEMAAVSFLSPKKAIICITTELIKKITEKTPEQELHEDIKLLIDDAKGLYSRILASALMDIYNITKKQP